MFCMNVYALLGNFFSNFVTHFPTIYIDSYIHVYMTLCHTLCQILLSKIVFSQLMLGQFSRYISVKH